MYTTLGMLVGSAGPGGPEPSGYPAILDVTQTVLTSGTNRVVTLPAGIVAGQMILISNVSLNTSVDSLPAGYTPLSGSSSTFYKIAAGGETTALFTVNLSAGDTNTIAMVLTPVHQTTPPQTDSNSSSDDPPSVTATWGAANNLSIATLISVASGGSITDYPGNCPLYRETFSAAIYDAAIAAAETLLATFDPGTFTATVGNQIARNIMVRGT